MPWHAVSEIAMRKKKSLQLNPAALIRRLRHPSPPRRRQLPSPVHRPPQCASVRPLPAPPRSVPAQPGSGQTLVLQIRSIVVGGKRHDATQRSELSRLSLNLSRAPKARGNWAHLGVDRRTQPNREGLGALVLRDASAESTQDKHRVSNAIAFLTW